MKSYLTALIVCITSISWAQKYKSVDSSVSFFSSATIEDLSAVTTKGSSIINLENSELAFSIPINTFEFEKSLMQEHFNEKYMESDKYPKSTFVGVFSGFDIGKQGKQQTKAEGELIIHGVKKNVSATGWMEYKDEAILLESSFDVKLEDYKVKIPKLLWQNIAEQVKVNIKFEYEKYE